MLYHQDIVQPMFGSSGPLVNTRVSLMQSHPRQPQMRLARIVCLCSTFELRKELRTDMSLLIDVPNGLNPRKRLVVSDSLDIGYHTAGNSQQSLQLLVGQYKAG
jgi:hypothetical protein